MRLAGFDVFDTALIRALGSPEAVFRLLEARLAARGVLGNPSGFAAARTEADARARAKAGGREVRLDEIYSELQHALRFTEAQRESALGAELQLEEELLRPVPEIATRIVGARKRGDAIAFLSDTYLSAEFVKDQLQRHGLLREGDTCLVSSSDGATKWSGEAFRRILERTGVKPRRFRFCGNHAHADCQVPRSLGARAEHFGRGNLNRYERILEDHCSKHGSLASVFAGASRLARLGVETSSPEESEIRDVTAGVIAPTLVSFALWILDRCQTRGTRRLYFLSRDAHLLLTVTEAVARRLGRGVETRYLYSSRRAWLPACLTRIEPGQLAWAFEDSHFVSVRSLLHRLGIEPDQISESLRGLDLPENRWEENLDKQQRESLREAVLHDTTIGHQILDRAKTDRDRLFGYLRQEGLFEDVPWALVDLGWHASTQQGLQRLWTTPEIWPQASIASSRMPTGFYFGLRNHREGEDASALDAEGYFLDERRGVGFVKNELPQLGAIMETLCAPAHGPLEALSTGADGVEPVLRPLVLTTPQRRFLDLVQTTVSVFIEGLFLDAAAVDLRANMRPAVHDLIHSFWNAPSEREARAWGRFPVDDRLGKPLSSTLARPFEWLDVWRIYRRGWMALPEGCMWFAGCFVQTSAPVRVGMKLANRAASVREALHNRAEPH